MAAYRRLLRYAVAVLFSNGMGRSTLNIDLSLYTSHSDYEPTRFRSSAPLVRRPPCRIPLVGQ